MQVRDLSILMCLACILSVVTGCSHKNSDFGEIRKSPEEITFLFDARGRDETEAMRLFTALFKTDPTVLRAYLVAAQYTGEKHNRVMLALVVASYADHESIMQ